MSDSTVALLGCVAAVGLFAMMLWQLKCGQLIDPLLGTFARGRMKRVALWVTTVVYGGLTLVCVVAAVQLFRGD